MKYLGPISDDKDLVNKEYVDNHSGGSDHIELTQAEYDVLTPAQKTNGTVYFITDGEPDIPDITINDSVPIGAIQSYGGSTAPYGWILCDGRAVNRSAYSELFNVIGTTYGSGDGSTTFNVPDLRGRVLIGESSSYAIGSNGGKESVTLSAAIGACNNNGESLGYCAEPRSEYQAGHQATYIVTGGGVAYSKWNHSTPVTDFNSSSRNTSIMQPYLVGNYIIKAKEPTIINITQSPVITDFIDVFYPVGSYYESSDASFDPNAAWGGTWVLETSGQVHVSAGTGYALGSTGGEATHTLTVEEMPSHKHDIYEEYGSKTNLNVSVPGQYNSVNNTNFQANYKRSEPICNTGGSQPHNNMQPYIVVNRWHRTA